MEDRVESRDRMYSRVIRKLIFDEIYSDRNAVLGQKPIPAKIISNLKVKDLFLSSLKKLKKLTVKDISLKLNLTPRRSI